MGTIDEFGWLPIALAPGRVRDLAGAIEGVYQVGQLRCRLAVEEDALVAFWVGETDPPEVTYWKVIADLNDPLFKRVSRGSGESV